MTTMTFSWRGDDFAADVSDTADDTLAQIAFDAVRMMKEDAPVDTGALSGSERAAPPTFSGDESGIYVLDYGGTPQTILQSVPDIRALIQGNALLVGSWIYYAYWVERGTSNPNYPRQTHIAPAGDAAMQTWRATFTRLWQERMARP